VFDTYEAYLEGSDWIYAVLKSYGYKLMHYSGDTDGAVGLLGTRRWIRDMKFKVTNEWRPWLVDD